MTELAKTASKAVKSSTSNVRSHFDVVERAREIYLSQIKRAEAEYFERIKRAASIMNGENALAAIAEKIEPMQPSTNNGLAT